MSKLLSQGGFGCVYYPGIKCDGKTDYKKTIVTKLQKLDFNAYNEIKIGEMIKKITYYKLFYLPVIKSCPINLRSINNSVLSKCEVIKHSDELKYILMTIPYISNLPFFSILTEGSSDMIGKKHMFLNLTETYR